jgi:hypothetical protein
MKPMTKHNNPATPDKKYIALLIRADARRSVDTAKEAHRRKTGIDLNYSQFVSMLCNKYVQDI